ncbi:hypothetical protein BDN70DRAFT_882403 [Pholiota conissans]|uniref:Uncharacterized protein n=1 Tax=Pholiota conissans TaxID=109636 RepID=A0A9P5YVD0_9AGAR|nr:hypothetical protein BDN70DRAFT_882403 [Pholiota conissans]
MHAYSCSTHQRRNPSLDMYINTALCPSHSNGYSASLFKLPKYVVASISIPPPPHQ